LEQRFLKASKELDESTKEILANLPLEIAAQLVCASAQLQAASMRTYIDYGMTEEKRIRREYD